MQIRHFIHCLLRGLKRKLLQLLIHRLRDAGRRHRTAEILIRHRNRTVHQITESIRQIRIQPLYHQLPADDSVIIERHLMQHKITDGIHAEEGNQIIRIQHIPPGFAHLHALAVCFLRIGLKKPRVSEYLLRQRKPQSHQHDRPVDRMEAENILSDQMKIRRPELPEQFAALSVRIISKSRDIVAERVNPDIHDMLIVKIHRNSPFEGSPGYTQILQARYQKVIHHLILPGFRLNELRMAVDMINQSLRIFAKSQEIRFLSGGLTLSAAVRAFAVHQLGRRKEGFARRTIHSFIISLVDIPLIVKLLKYLLNLSLMVFVGCPDELIIRRIHQIPYFFDLPCHMIHEFLRTDSGLPCLRLDLLTMLVGSCLKEHIVSLQPLESGNTVCKHNLIRIADMGLAGRIGNGCCDIIWLSAFLTHKRSPFLSD